MHQKPPGDVLQKLVIIAASCVISFTNYGIARLAGQLFVAAIHRFNTGRREASLPFTLCYSIRNLLGPVFGYLGNRFGLRPVTLLGCLLSAISVGSCFLVEDIIPFTVLWGGCFGFSFGLGTTLIPNILHLYFDKSFNKIHGIFQTFGCMGALVLPGVCDFLHKTYGMSGTFLFLSGFILNCLPGAMLLRKPRNIPNLKKVIDEKLRDDKILDGRKVETNFSNQNVKHNGLNSSDITAKCTIEIKPTHCDMKYLEKAESLKSPNVMCTEGVKKTNIYCINLSEYERQDNPLASRKETEALGDVTKPSSQTHNTEYQPQKYKLDIDSLKDTKSNETPKSKFKDFSRNLDINSLENTKTNDTPKSKFRDFSRNFKVFLDPTYTLILISLGITTVVSVVLYTVIVDVCRDKDITQDVAVLMTFAVTDMAGRGLMPHVADLGGCFSQVGVCVFCSGCYGLLLMSLAWTKSFYMVLMVISAVGIMSGGLIVIPLGIIREWVEKDNLTMGFSSRYVVFALMSFAQSPIIGYFRETLKSYDGLFYLMGGMCLFAAMIASLIPMTAAYRDKKKEDKHGSAIEERSRDIST